MAHVPSADRRRQFIEAASRVIETHGVARATTRNIAQEAGAPLGALHYCFGTKEELFEAVSHTFGRLNLAPAMESVRPGMGITAAVPVLLQSTAKFIAANITSELGELEIYVWALRNGRPEMPRRTYEIWMGLVEEALRTARTEDELDQDISAITRLLASLVDGCALMELMTSEQRLEESAESASRTVVAAIEAGVFRRN
ncbi:TetR/AcrR family transcriptional regulator [Mycobacterium sp. DL440]|uniref:TetR/AcrR family transcriptional regulator n=1 Tax=Mycobacterium sp. DL440 TaxID=2675523 RepID=UPI0014204EB8|nr:TetR/AcrR family transcriptional regulator [Mycobacterium sp. DL440]